MIGSHPEQLRAKAFLRLLEWEGAKLVPGDRLVLVAPGLPELAVSYNVSKILYDYVEQCGDGAYRLKREGL